MTRIPHTPESLAALLAAQTRLLSSAAKLFDEGHLEQSLSMATIVRVLLRDHQPNSVSLLKQTGFKEKLRFVDTSMSNTTVFTNAPNVSIEVEHGDGTTGYVSMGQDGLVDITFENSEAYYVASCRHVDGRKLRLPFAPWWENPIMDLPNRGRYSRWDLVSAMSHQAGGAHVDPKGLEDGYARFAKEGYPFYFSNNPGNVAAMNPLGMKMPTGDAAAASMRQLAFEVLETISECKELQSWLKSPS